MVCLSSLSCVFPIAVLEYIQDVGYTLLHVVIPGHIVPSKFLSVFIVGGGVSVTLRAAKLRFFCLDISFSRGSGVLLIRRRLNCVTYVTFVNACLPREVSLLLREK